MIKTFANNHVGAHFAIADEPPLQILREEKPLMFIWNDGISPAALQIDGQFQELYPGRILCVTYLHNLQIDNSSDHLKYLLFNREFYCIHTNDSEVSCNGLLFFGSHFVPILDISNGETESFKTLFSVLSEEFDNTGTGQEEMLRILLKRFIIKCTRLANQQIVKNGEKQSDIDLIRHFNVLVEEHFKTRKTVKEYAELMFKSPKTIANVFSKNSEHTPLEVIHNRVIIEAKRMLLYTDNTVKQIGMDLGYNDPAQFSKLFKKQTGMTTTKFKYSKQFIISGKY
ncbi:helix-turn-helix domain-containing protein [soil metagenome]